MVVFKLSFAYDFEAHRFFFQALFYDNLFGGGIGILNGEYEVFSRIFGSDDWLFSVYERIGFSWGLIMVDKFR